MSNVKNKILKNASAYTFVGILPFLTSFITLPIYTRYMTPEDYGIVSLVVTFQSILATMVSFQMAAALPRYYFEYAGMELRIFFSTTVYSVVMISFALLIGIHLVGSPLIEFSFPKADIPYFPYFFISLFTVFMAQISQVSQRLLVVQERGGEVLYRSLFSTVIGIAAGMFFVVYLNMGALGALCAGIFGGFFGMVFNLWLTKDFFVLQWRKAYFIQSLKYSWPIVPHAMGGFLFMYSDKVVMEKFISLSAIGLYSIADRMSMILKLLVNSINNALIPSFMRLATQSEKRAVNTWKPLITKWAVLISVSYLALAFFSEEVILILTPEKYHAAYPIVPILLIGYIFRGFYCFSSAPLFFRKQTKKIPLITFSAGIVNVGANILLIPVLGVYGAAWTTALSFFITFILAEYFSKSCFSIQYEWALIIEIFFVMFLCASTIFFITDQPILLKFLIKLICFFGFCMFLWLRNFGDFKNDFWSFWNAGKLFLRRSQQR